MLDATLRPIIDKPLKSIALKLEHSFISPNAVTWSGFFIGLIGAGFILLELYWGALVFILMNRFLDGVDGALARLRGPTDYGGYIDIVLDFIFYSTIPFAFAVVNEQENALAASFLILSFIGTGGSFLTYAIFAEKNKITTDIRGKKSFFYLGGLTEGTETIMLFVAFCIWPSSFALLSYIFGGLCWITTATRIYAAQVNFTPEE